jgi:hypothetical protein
MAEIDLKSDRAPVQLDMSRRDRKFLKEVLTMARDGVREELCEHGERLREPRRLRREAAAYERLLGAVEERRVIPDPELCAVLDELAAIVDESNEYARVVAEHKAMRGMAASLDRRGGHCPGRGDPCAAMRCAGTGPTSRSR